MKEIKIGHFTGKIKHGSKTMIEIDLQSDRNYSLLVMGKKIKLENIGLQSHNSLNTQSVKSLFKIITQIQYCKGVSTVEKNLPHFHEHICHVGDDNNEVLKFRAKNCSKVLPFKTSNAAVSVCQFCKKMKIKPKLNKSECDVQNTDDESGRNEPCIAKTYEVILQKTDHEDLSEILKTIFS